MMKYVFLLVFLPAVMCGQQLPNIIFCLADDLGYGELSYTGSVYDTPTIDSLANNGAFFSNFHVATVCTPSRYRFMTGKYAFRGALESLVVFPYDTIGMNAEEITIAEHLKEAGYMNGHFGKWHVGGGRPDFLPLMQGFDYSWGTVTYFTNMKNFLFDDTWVRSVNQEEDRDACAFATDCQTDAAIEWMTLQAADESAPFFLYMAYTNPHDDAYGLDSIPYKASDLALAPGGYTTMQKQKWANIKNMDDSVAELWQAVVNLGIEDNTIIIFTSDNGPDETNAPENGPYSGYKLSNYEGGLRVPMVWYHSGTVTAGVEIDSLTSIEDFLPTFVEGIIGKSVRAEIDGQNIYPALLGQPIPQKSWIGTFIKDRMWSVQKGNWKLVNNIAAELGTGTLSESVTLYDLATDPGETTNVSGAYPAKVAELRAIIDAETAPTSRSGQFSKPAGWNNPRWWGDPTFFYDPDFLYQLIREQ